jgi:hypothetical protein
LVIEGSERRYIDTRHRKPRSRPAGMG